MLMFNDVQDRCLFFIHSYRFPHFFLRAHSLHHISVTVNHRVDDTKWIKSEESSLRIRREYAEHKGKKRGLPVITHCCVIHHWLRPFHG